jgi:hypothetical protein
MRTHLPAAAAAGASNAAPSAKWRPSKNGGVQKNAAGVGKTWLIFFVWV